MVAETQSEGFRIALLSCVCVSLATVSLRGEDLLNPSFISGETPEYGSGEGPETPGPAACEECDTGSLDPAFVQRERRHPPMARRGIVAPSPPCLLMLEPTPAQLLLAFQNVQEALPGSSDRTKAKAELSRALGDLGESGQLVLASAMRGHEYGAFLDRVREQLSALADYQGVDASIDFLESARSRSGSSALVPALAPMLFDAAINRATSQRLLDVYVASLNTPENRAKALRSLGTQDYHSLLALSSRANKARLGAILVADAILSREVSFDDIRVLMKTAEKLASVAMYAEAVEFLRRAQARLPNVKPKYRDEGELTREMFARRLIVLIEEISGRAARATP